MDLFAAFPIFQSQVDFTLSLSLSASNTGFTNFNGEFNSQSMGKTTPSSRGDSMTFSLLTNFIKLLNLPFSPKQDTLEMCFVKQIQSVSLSSFFTLRYSFSFTYHPNLPENESHAYKRTVWLHFASSQREEGHRCAWLLVPTRLRFTRAWMWKWETLPQALTVMRATTVRASMCLSSHTTKPRNLCYPSTSPYLSESFSIHPFAWTPVLLYTLQTFTRNRFKKEWLISHRIKHASSHIPKHKKCSGSKLQLMAANCWKCSISPKETLLDWVPTSSFTHVSWWINKETFAIFFNYYFPFTTLTCSL